MTQNRNSHNHIPDKNKRTTKRGGAQFKHSLRAFKFLCLMSIALLMGSFLVSGLINAGGVISVEAESVDPATFRDYTIISGSGTTKAIDGNHNIKWEVSFSALDKEMLPNGNLLTTSDPRFETSAVREINITSNTVAWEIHEVDGMQIEFTHDVDWLGVDESGQDIFIIADTANDRVVEFFRNGTVIWSWYVIDHYAYGDPSNRDWSHINDVDRLPDGTTMISLKNFNIIVIVNTTAEGEVIWEYGEYLGYPTFNGPHNPEYTPKGTLLIADSSKDQVIEVNMTTKEIIWDYTPTDDAYLGWVRDADLLPNGNILICDSKMGSSGKNRVWEINTTTKEPVWYHDTEDQNYDAERMDTVLPTVNILSPTANIYKDTTVVPVSLSCDDPWYDEMFYRIYDETAGEWVTEHNITYDGPTEAVLESQHTYTFYAWAKDLVMEGGAYPTSRAIVQLEEDSVKFTTGTDEDNPEVSDVNVVTDGDIIFTVTATDQGSWVKKVTVEYVYNNDDETGNNSADMTNAEGNIWTATIPAFSSNTTLTYTITAEDNAGNTVTTDTRVYNYVKPTQPKNPTDKTTTDMNIVIAATIITVLIGFYAIYLKRRKPRSK